MAEGSTREMSDEHRSLLERNKFFFSDHLDLTEKFYNLLLHCKILTDKMYKNIKAKSAGNPDREVRELVDLVTRRGDRALYWFLEVLKQTGQQGIVNHLQQQLGGDTPLAPAGSGHVMAHRPPTKRPIRETGSGDRPPSRFPVQVQSPSGPSPSIRTQSRYFPNHDVRMYAEGLPWSDRSQENPPESGQRGLEDHSPLRYPVQARSAQENQLEPGSRPGTSHSDLTGETPRTSYPSEGYRRPGIPHRETADERPRASEGAPRPGILWRDITPKPNAESSVEPSRHKLELLNLREGDDEMETPRHKLYERGNSGLRENPVDPSRTELELSLHEDDERETPRHKLDDGGTDRPGDPSLTSIEIPYEINKPGIMVIIDIHKFSDPLHDRHGTEKDVTNLRSTFTALKFKVCVKYNMNYKDFWKFLNKFLDDRHRDYSSVGLIVMSHGQNDNIFTADLHAVPFREVLEAVSKTESLQSKPKLIIFHVCRQENNLPEMNATGRNKVGGRGGRLGNEEEGRGGRGLGNEEEERGGRGLVNEERGRVDRENEQRGQGTVQGRELPTTAVSHVRMDGERSEGSNERSDVRETVEPITNPNLGIRGRVLEPQGAGALDEPEDANAQRTHPTTVLQLGASSRRRRGADEDEEEPSFIEFDAREEEMKFEIEIKREKRSRQQLTEEKRQKAIFSPIIEFDANGARLGGASPTGGSGSARGPDMIIVYPTLYGMSAGRIAGCPDERSQYEGSYLITVLCRVFNKYAATYDIERMLTNVKKNIRKHVQEILLIKQKDAGSSSGASDVGGASVISGASGFGGTSGIGGASNASGGSSNNLLSPSSNDNVEDQIVEVVSTLENPWFLNPNKCQK